MTEATVFEADDPAFEDAVEIRERVFVDGQGVPPDRELDGYDDEATHFLLRVDGEPVGTARLREYEADESYRDPDEPPGHREEPRGRTGKIERVAVLAEHRGEGYGDAVMDAVETYAAEVGFDRLVLDAQTRVVEFYERRGYEVTSEEPFEDAGIPHLRMETEL